VPLVDATQVGCTLEFDVTEPAEIALLIAAAAPAAESVTAGDQLAVREIPGRQFLVRAPRGTLTIRYQATVPPAEANLPPVSDVDRIAALRPSRYCPSDRLGGFAASRFGNRGDTATTVRAITDWVHQHLVYTAGSSGPTTDAIDTMLSGAGVCRDYAHLVATLCRACDIPARVAAVYAPGLSPMDFHLVAETVIDGEWRVWDATRLAPRQSLIRIVTGRDAADTAFATTIGGALTLTRTEIYAVAPGDLPIDDHQALVSLPAPPRS
jgi:transglutaminase-like putative cysteine protease